MKKVFISYTGESEEHKAWVEGLASRLRKDGVSATLDLWEIGIGDELPKFMEEGVRDHDRVLVICTPEYKRKADGRYGGVGYETSQITGEVLNDPKRGKFVPVLRKGLWKDAAPSYLLGIKNVDLRDGNDERYEQEYHNLLIDLLDRRRKAPPVGVPASETQFDNFKLSFLQDKLMGQARRVGPGDIRYTDGLLMNRARLKYIIDRITENADITGGEYWIEFFQASEFDNAIQNNIWKNGANVYTYSEAERWEVLKRSAQGLKIRLGRVLGAQHVQCRVMDDGSVCLRYIK